MFASFSVTLQFLYTSARSLEIPTLKLSDGREMSQIGLGVYRAEPGEECYKSVRWSLEAGYRLIDTAQMYENEANVGWAIVDAGVKREDVFITTKLATESHGYDEAIDATEESLKAMEIEYIDLLLMHSPFGESIVETWDAMIELQEQGKVKSIGVSNFGIKHLEALKEYGRPAPAVNQFELHPLNYQERLPLVQYCQKNQIAITAYGSLFSGQTERYNDPILQKLAIKYNKSVPQILLRWAVDNGFAVIPKSTSSKKRVEENLNILDFKLDSNEVNEISAIKGEALDEYWDPVNDADVDIGDLDRDDEEDSNEEL